MTPEQHAFRSNWRTYCLGASLAGDRPPLDIRDASAGVACVMHVLRELEKHGLDFDVGRVELVVQLVFDRDVGELLRCARDYYANAHRAIKSRGQLLAAVWEIAAALRRQEEAERRTEQAAAELRRRRGDTDRMIDSLRRIAA